MHGICTFWCKIRYLLLLSENPLSSLLVQNYLFFAVLCTIFRVF
nr:MAG TPA: hypothetical protein [Caudoviricetes sp.]